MYVPVPTVDVKSAPAGERPEAKSSRTLFRDLLILLLLTLGALLVHGYHPGAEDAEIYLPGVERMLHPKLFPFDAQFFQPHAHSTLFPNLMAASVRWSRLPLSVVLFSWQIASIFLLLLACWQLSGKCFAGRGARWAGVTLIAALLTLPVAGTALYIMDQYVNPRNLAAFPAILAILKILDRKYLQAGLFLIFAAVIHPFMSMFAVCYCLLLGVGREFGFRPVFAGSLLPFGITLEPPSKAYHLVAASHPFHYITRWHWYEWLGAVAPLAILWWFSRIAHRRAAHDLESMCRALVVFELIFLPAAVVLSIPVRLEALARLQPMRCLYLLYILMFLFGGALLGEYVLKNRVWRWLGFFLPLCLAMFVTQRTLFPADAHIEWPGASPRNPWVGAFEWVRGNTPDDALFALDPSHMTIPGEDEQGFRAIAQRSRLADNWDSGQVSMFPALADEWFRQVGALDHWKSFQLEDFRNLRAEYRVTWLVLQAPGLAGLDCPYRNAAVLVCRLTP
ncbi:MAG: hypothetical protein WB952_06120 [Terriglobales bacterium]